MDFEEYVLTIVLIIATVGILGGFAGMVLSAWHLQFGHFMASGLVLLGSWVIGSGAADQL